VNFENNKIVMTNLVEAVPLMIYDKKSMENRRTFLLLRFIFEVEIEHSVSDEKYNEVIGPNGFVRKFEGNED
jgi:3-dehydroquinate synthetase